MRARTLPRWTAALLAAALAGCDGEGWVVVGPDDGTGELIPNVRTVYDVTVTGTAFFGNTASPTATTVYSPLQAFSLGGVLVVEPTRDRGGPNLNNGLNLRDLALFVGDPVDAPLPGAAWFATNTAMFAGIPGIVPASLANTDVAFATGSTAQGTLTAQFDARFYTLTGARGTLLNAFNVTGGPAAEVFEVTAGTLELRFTERGARAQGTLVLTGAGFFEPGSARIEAAVSATRR